MADVYKQMQKQHCHDGAPNGGKRPYGCPCCRPFKKGFKKWSRRQARKMLKRLPDDMVGTRR